MKDNFWIPFSLFLYIDISHVMTIKEQLWRVFFILLFWGTTYSLSLVCILTGKFLTKLSKIPTLMKFMFLHRNAGGLQDDGICIYIYLISVPFIKFTPTATSSIHQPNGNSSASDYWLLNAAFNIGEYFHQ